MNLEERLAEIESAAAQPGGLAWRSVVRMTEGKPDLLRALEAAAVPQWWNETTLLVVLDDDLAKDVPGWTARLCDLSVTEPFLTVPGAFNIREVTRRALREKLRAENRLVEFSARALRAISMPSSDVMPDRTIEKLYHQLVSEPEVGAEALEGAWREWSNQGRWAMLLDLAGMLEEVLPLLEPPARARALLRRATIRSDRCDIAEIKDQATESLHLFRELHLEEPQSQALSLLGDLATAQGHLNEAHRLFGEALSIRQRLAASQPANLAPYRELSLSFEKLGNLAIAQRNLSESLRLFNSSLQIRQRLADSDPANATWQRDVSASLEKLSDLATAREDFNEAQRFLGDSLQIRYRLAEADPSNAVWQRDLSASFEKLGDLANALGNVPEAKRLFGEALNITQLLAKSDPANSAWQRHLSVSYERLGDIENRLGNHSEAQRLFGESFRVRQRIAESDPANALWQRELSDSFIKLGNLPRELSQSHETIRLADQLPQTHDVFLCHNSVDKEEVKKLGERLRQIGIRPWLDVWEIRPGTDWMACLESQIEQISTVAVFVGNGGFGPWQVREQRAFLLQFMRRECPIIPVLLSTAKVAPKLPIFLESFHYVDFRVNDPDPFQQLVWGITGKKPL